MPGEPTSNPLAVDRPTRDADRNRSLAGRADPSTGDVLLPSLDDGITLLDVEAGRDTPILQSLVLDHLLLHEGCAVWVDADGDATTTSLARIAPSRRLLTRIHVARGFTAYQHYGAVCDLPMAVDRSVRRATDDDASRNRPSGRDESSPHTLALIVAPAVDARYRADDTLGEAHAETLQARTLARLTAYAEDYDVPVLVTRSVRDEFTAPVATAADHRLECERTRTGPRFVGDDFETLVYPVDGAYYQTTFAYWRQLLGARAERTGLEPAPPSTEDAAGAGTGTTAEGGPTTFGADPLLDAWTAGGAGGR